MVLDKNSINARHKTAKKIIFCFWLQYYWRAWDKDKIQSHRTITEKKNSFLSTVLLDGTLKKIQSTLELYQKKAVSDYSATMAHGTWEKCNLTRPSPKKNSDYNTTVVHGTEKKNEKKYFRSRLQYYYDAWDLKKNQSCWNITEKNIFLFLTTVLLWCTELRNFLVGTRPHRKKFNF